MEHTNSIRMIARIGIFGTFLGHGLLAISVNPKWIPLLTCYGFSESQAIFLMPLIGMLDLFVAAMALFYPIRIVLIWAAFWAFITAVSRPISGDGIVEFVERSANWSLPLLLLLLQGVPRTFTALFRVADLERSEKKNRPRVRAV